MRNNDEKVISTNADVFVNNYNIYSFFEKPNNFIFTFTRA